jgi:hypothetical protein
MASEAGNLPHSHVHIVTEEELLQHIDATKKVDVLVDVFDVTRPPPTKEEREKLPRGTYSAILHTLKSVYVRTHVSVVLKSLLDAHGCQRAFVSTRGDIVLTAHSKSADQRHYRALVGAGLVIQHLLPLVSEVVKRLVKFTPEQFAPYADKQTSISDVSFVSSAVYAAKGVFTTDMAYAFKVGSFCNLKDAVWSLAHEQSLGKGIEAEISTRPAKEVNHIRGFAFGRPIVTEFQMPSNLKVVGTSMEFDEDEKYDAADASYLLTSKRNNQPRADPAAKNSELAALIAGLQATLTGQKADPLKQRGGKKRDPPAPPKPLNPDPVAEAALGSEEEELAP